MSSGRNKRIAEEVKKRDGMCIGCGCDQMDAHHLDSWGAHRTDDPTRMVALCRICHTKWHSGDPDIRQRVEAYLKRIASPTWVVEVPQIAWDQLLEFLP